ncbi:MAG: hypothetical protein ACSLE5_13050 [Porticoccaceae bacterium]
MNPEPIENARDTDLRLSRQALQRAARRAYELAARTGTAIIVSRNGVIEYIEPNPADVVPVIQKQAAPVEGSL